MDQINKKNVLILSAVAALFFGFGYFATPNKVEEKIVYKESSESSSSENQNKKKVTKKEKITYKDGTVKETETEVDSSSSSKESKNKTQKESITQKTVTKDTGITIQAMAIIDTVNISKREYGIYFKKRIFSNISVGAMATTDKKIGIGLGLDF